LSSPNLFTRMNNSIARKKVKNRIHTDTTLYL
jgi:hypothetical protein